MVFCIMISFQTLFYFLACNAVMLVIAMVMEALLGWPDWLYRKIGHPVSWIAKLITWCDTRLNRNSASSFRRKSAGIVTLLCCAGSAAVIAGGLAWLAGMFTADLMYLFIMGCLSWPFIASRSLYSHVRAVLVPLQAQELQAARSALGMIGIHSALFCRLRTEHRGLSAPQAGYQEPICMACSQMIISGQIF